jgi:pimeloyl-ACP methyl ester carboxylesterase
VPFLDRSGVKIYYEDNGHDPAILLSHGYGATCRMWDAQIAAFVPHNRIIVWDMRGHGETDDPKDPAAYSEAALMHHHRIERAVIGGLSLGGYMSLAFHLAYPEIVGALTLFDTGPGFRNADARRAWTERAQQWLGTSRRAVRRPWKERGGSAPASIARHVASPVRRAACSRRSTTSSPGSTRSPCRPWCWSAPMTGIFSLQPTTWRARSRVRRG